MVVPVEHREHVRVLRDDFLLQKLAGVVEQPRIRLLHVGVTMQADDGLAIGVLREHLVHPVDLVGVDVPAHVQNQEVLTVLGEQVIVAEVVLVRAAVPGVAVVAVLAEVLPVVAVTLHARVDVVVARKNAVGDARVVEDLHGVVGVHPFAAHVHVVDDVAGVHDVADAESLRVVHDPLVHVVEVVREALGVVLGVGFPGEREVVALGKARAVPAGLGRLARPVEGLQGHGLGEHGLVGKRRRRVAFGGNLLHENHRIAVAQVVGSRELAGHLAVRIGGCDLFPTLRCEIVGVHRDRVGVIDARRLALPGKRQGVALGGGSHLRLEQLRRERAVVGGRLVGRCRDDIVSGKRAALAEAHIGGVVAHVDRQVRRRGRDAVAVRVDGHVGVVVLDGELHLRGRGVAGLVDRDDGEHMLPHRKLLRVDGGRQREVFPVERGGDRLQPVRVARDRRGVERDSLIERLAVINAQVNRRFRIVDDDVGRSRAVLTLRGHGMRAVGDLRGVPIKAHGRSVRRGNLEHGVEVGLHSRRIADRMPYVERRTRVGLLVVGRDAHRQVALAVRELHLQAGHLVILMVLAEHRGVERLLERRARIARPQGQRHVVGVFLRVVREVLVVDMHRTRRGRFAPRPHDGDDIARVVAVGRGDGVFEVAVHATRLHHEPGAVLEGLARVGDLAAVDGNGCLRVVGAIVGGDRRGARDDGAVLERQTHAVGGVQAVDLHRLLVGLAHAVKGVGAHLVGDLVVAEQHVRGDLHHEMPQAPLGLLLDNGPVGIVVELVEHLGAEQVRARLERLRPAGIVRRVVGT